MKRKGKGIACMIYPMDPSGKSSSSAAVVKVNHDGTAVVFIGAPDLGQGSTTVLAQIAAEELGIRFEEVRMIVADSELTPYDEATGASRVTYIVGNAVKRAASKARQILLEAAARKLNIIDAEKLVAEKGIIYFDGYSHLNISIADAAWASEREFGKPIVAADSFGTVGIGLDPETGQGKVFEKHIFATQIAEVEVDTETGQVEILKVVAVHDCGRAINPLLVEGQIEGGVSMGIGYALMEEMIEDDETGELLNNSFVDYHLPTAMDMPKDLVVGIVECPDKDGPFGALGIGEPTPCPTAPAIINAIYDAVGVKIRDLPATPEKVLKAIKGKEAVKGKLF
ncbi:MAG: molybdopterin-dependent oxidoreductase [Bacillota bacterium]|nr:molybdopterin-dependent oxidoreductase [Bacillota bacterium]